VYCGRTIVLLTILITTSRINIIREILENNLNADLIFLTVVGCIYPNAHANKIAGRGYNMKKISADPIPRIIGADKSSSTSKHTLIKRTDFADVTIW
jgi:hypothetical protein